ncbi:MAG TPA: DUF2249 domain-containing protein [Gemmatimonadales bacterium]|nr:DUF2249 domain-containing protein [Gemmatimonadales bacterium]
MNRRRMDAMKATTTARTTAPTAPRPEALEVIAPDQLVELDVREDLRNGREPFSLIMAARQRVPEGGALAVRAIFEPVPLYAVMGKQGFTHYTEQLGEEDWRVWFYPPAQAAAVPTAAALAATPPDDAMEPGLIVLDVREMEPPEPMVLTLEALETLPPGGTLLQVNVRVPQFLLPLLEERGFSYEVRQQAPDLVRVFIRHRPADTPAHSHQSRGPEMTATRTLDVRVIPPREKHPTIFTTFSALAPGESFVLVNDHDPKPLRYQFEYEHAGQFGWEYLEEGPTVWRVQISRSEG